MSLSFLLGGFGETIGNFFSALFQIFNQLIRYIFVIGYQVFRAICYIITFAEYVFKKVAGIDNIVIDGTEYGNSGQDLVYGFITNEAVLNVFWAIMALSLVLLLIFTIIAFIKSEFTLDLKGSAKGPIIGRALKSVVNLIAVPVISIIAIFGVNFLTRTIYELFDTPGESLSAKCFKLGAYTANRARTDEKFVEFISSGDFAENGGELSGISGNESLANTIDEYFIQGHDSNLVFKKIPWNEKAEYEEEHGYVDWFTLIVGLPEPNSTFSWADVKMVNYFYDLAEFQFVLGFGAAVSIAWIMLSVCIVLIKRVFELTILFLLAPPMTAIAPLDGGQAEKKWRQEFTKRLISVVGTVFAYNMFFLLLPIFEGIEIFDLPSLNASGALGNGLQLSGTILNLLIPIFNIFFELICVIIGLSIVKSASALISGLLGVDDLVKSGGESMKKAVATGKAAALVSTAAGGVILKGTAAAFKVAASPFASMVNTARTQIGRKKAKEQLPEAKNAMDEAQKEFDPLEKQYQEAKSRKDRIESLEDRSSLTDDESAELANLKSKQAGIDLDSLEQERNDAKQKLDSAKRDYGYREAGVSEGRQKRAERTAKRRSGLAKASKTVGNWKSNAGNWLIGEHDKILSKEEREKAIEEAGQSAYDKSHTKSQASFVSATQGRNLLKNIRNAYVSEFGSDANTQSFGAKISGFVNDKAQGLKNVPIFKKIPDLTNSLKEMYSIDGDTAKRRLNDGLAGVFGDGGGGDLWKMWFNKNARANLYEGVPESKKRSANIDNSLAMAARDKYAKDEAEKKDRKSEEKLIRRMLAAEKGGEFAREYSKLYETLEKGGLNKIETDKIEAKMAKMELEGGINSIKSQAEQYYNKSGPGSEKLAKLEEFRSKMQQDAANAAYRKEKADRDRAIQAALSNDGKYETKITEQSSEHLAKAIANALHGGKGIKLSSEKPIDLNLTAFTEGITSVRDAIADLSKSISQLTGGDDSTKKT